jgi:TPR repeat protein
MDLGHLPSRALKAWMLLGGRKGVAQDWDGAFELVQEGARLGCHHCQGVMAGCYLFCYRIRKDEAQSLELARKSSGLGSRYGQYVLGKLYQYGAGGVAQDYTQAVALHRLAVAQNLDWAQCALGDMYANGIGVAQDHTEALRFYMLAAAQGHAISLHDVARYHELGLGIPGNEGEAIHWYRRAQTAGHPYAAAALLRLRA